MKVVRAFFIAFSMYSSIPVPQFEWRREDMKYVFCFFPWVGAVTGLCVWLWGMACGYLQIGNTAYTLVGTALPLLLTGGIHADGYMDTMDALHSWQGKERKLEILKDPHIGAFSVLMLLFYYLIYGAAFSEVSDRKGLALVCLGFVLSRTMSALTAILLKPAKKEGLLFTFTDSADKKPVVIVLGVELALCCAGILALSWQRGLLLMLGAAACTAYYRRRSYREFGGVTGDTAGYFLLLCEAATVAAAAVGCHMF